MRAGRPGGLETGSEHKPAKSFCCLLFLGSKHWEKELAVGKVVAAGLSCLPMPVGKPQARRPVQVLGGGGASRQLGAERCQRRRAVAWGEGGRGLHGCFATGRGGPRGVGSAGHTHTPTHHLCPPQMRTDTAPCRCAPPAQLCAPPRMHTLTPDVHGHPCRCAIPTSPAAMRPPHPPRCALAPPRPVQM